MREKSSGLDCEKWLGLELKDRELHLCEDIREKAKEMLSGKLNDVPSGRLVRADLGFLQMCQSL